MYLLDNTTCLSAQFENIIKACLEVIDDFEARDEQTIAKIRVILLEYESNLLAKAGQELIDKRDTIMRTLENNEPQTASALKRLFRP